MNKKPLMYRFIGSNGLEIMAENLISSAFTKNHPCFNWMKSFCTFIEINQTSKPELIPGFQTTIYKLDHLVETYGFSLFREKKEPDFAYIADTRWCNALAEVLKNKPRTVLIDLNGQEDGPKPVHLSLLDLKQKALPITKEETIYFGTHLKEEFTSTWDCIKCARPRMDIKV